MVVFSEENGAHMNIHLTDLALYDRLGQLVALVLVKNIRGTTKDWASEYRRNLREDTEWPRLDFFLLVTPDHLYLWKEAEISPEAGLVPPEVIDTEPLLGPYFDRMRTARQRLSGPAFDFLVTSWLRELMGFGTEYGPLDKTGFPESVREGRLVNQAAA
jgi:hypothetical protein